MKKIFIGENFEHVFLKIKLNSCFTPNLKVKMKKKNIILLIFLETMTQFLLFGEVVDMRILCEEWFRWV